MVSQKNTSFDTQANNAQANDMLMAGYAPVGVLRACISVGLFASVASFTANVAYASNTSVDVKAVPPTKLFVDCSQIQMESSRLACYDRVAETGRRPDLTKAKRQLDLTKTIKSTFKGKPKLVMNSPVASSVVVGNDADIIEVVNDNNVTKTVKPTKENMALIRKFYNVGRYDKKKALNAKQVGAPQMVEQTPRNNYFLNTEVIRKFYETAEHKHLTSNTIRATKYAKQNLANHVYANGVYANKESDYHVGSIFDNRTDGRVSGEVVENISASNYSPLSLAYDLDVNDEVGTWKPRPHNPMYILPLFLHDKPNRSPSTPSQDRVDFTQNQYRSPELKFQLSFKSKLAQDLFNTDADLWLGYTQQSHWQVYNEDNSRSFRAHDYEPELFLTQPVTANLPLGGKLRMLGGGFVHHSNGEQDPLSRSWNRAYLMGGAEWGKLTVVPRIWTRLRANSVNKKNENPDIEDYMGYGDLKMYYDLDGGNSVSGTFRLNPSTGHGSAQIDYIHAMDNNVNLYMNLFHGYGESLIDYNHEDTAVGVGVMLNDWRGL